MHGASVRAARLTALHAAGKVGTGYPAMPYLGPEDGASWVDMLALDWSKIAAWPQPGVWDCQECFSL